MTPDRVESTESAERYISLRVLLSEQCDLSCTFCHNEGQPGQSAELGITPQFLGDIVKSLKRLGSVQVKLSGGEPTRHPNFRQFVYSCLAAQPREVVIISNGNNSSAFEQVLGLDGLRVSLNLPTNISTEYERITGGSFNAVISTARLLERAGHPVAFNSYWPRSRAVHKLDQLINLAQSLGVDLKILCPCQLVEGSAQKEYASALSDYIQTRGFKLTNIRNHVRYFVRDSLIVRIQRPWCPDICRTASGRDVTLRITASGLIHSCLSRDLGYHGSVHAPLDVVMKRLEQAASAAGRTCGSTRISVPILRRSREANE
ncbi:radical SAM protein [Nocardia vinacea]|uniref:radical SAM protein n=1 Tax=Nocardia vinacea TaxID=96468 RepID=UPI00340C3D48